MVTATALALLTFTASISPTATVTYTPHEQAIYDKAFDAGITEQLCFVNCRILKDMQDYRKEKLTPKKSKNPEDNIGDDMIAAEAWRMEQKLYGENCYGSDQMIADKKRFLKKAGCDCSKFKNKRSK